MVDRFLPDKGIDILDITCSKVKLEKEYTLMEADGLTKKLLELEVVRSSLRNERGSDKAKVHEISAELNLFHRNVTYFCKGGV